MKPHGLISPEYLATAVALTDPTRDLDPSVRAWLRRGFAAYLTDPGQGLERALGLRVQRWSKAQRDRHIREAAAALPGSNYDRARTLATWATHPARAPSWPGRAGRELRLAQTYARGGLPRSVSRYRQLLAGER